MITLFQLKYLGVPKYTVIHDKLKDIIQDCGKNYNELRDYPLSDIKYVCLRSMDGEQKEYLSDCILLCSYNNLHEEGILTLPPKPLPRSMVYGKEKIKLTGVTTKQYYANNTIHRVYVGTYNRRTILINPNNINPYEYDSRYKGKGQVKPRFRELVV